MLKVRHLPRPLSVQNCCCATCRCFPSVTVTRAASGSGTVQLCAQVAQDNRYTNDSSNSQVVTYLIAGGSAVRSFNMSALLSQYRSANGTSGLAVILGLEPYFGGLFGSSFKISCSSSRLVTEL